MINYDNGLAPGGDASCWLPDYRDALRVAAHLGIPLLKLNFTKEYEQKVFLYMFAEYKKGRTPNPDVLCNTYIKFGVWLEWARKHGFDKLATGHYARLKIINHKSEILNQVGIRLLQAKDKNKDQTYFLHQLNQDQLGHVLFPIGGYTKPEVRTLAKKFKLPTAEKEESMGICFVGEVPMKEFLRNKIKTSAGKIITTNGDVIGKHEGLPFYTVGQRHLKISNSQFPISNQIQNHNDHTRPLFVVRKGIKKNTLIVGYENDPLLNKKEIELTNVYWVSGQPPKFPLHCEVRLRHRQPLQKATIKAFPPAGRIRPLAEKHKNIKTVMLEFYKAQRAPTPGQFAVFYKAGECLGGGVIL